MADYNINHHIYRVRQPDENSCWAACLVMKLEAMGRKCYTIDGIKNVAREAGVTINPNGSVATDEANMTKLGEAFNIRILKNRGVVQLEHIVPLIRQAPIILFGGFNYEGRKTPMNHAVLMTGLWGDGSDDTGLALVDPQNTDNGTNPEKDVVCSWRTLGAEIIDRLDFVSARV
jgi:hypothetical protein